MKIANYNFDGPYTSTVSLLNRSGVYVILDRRTGGTYVIDVGESHDVKNRVENHDRSNCWRSNSSGQLLVAVLYTLYQQQAGRKVIEDQIRAQYTPVCGER